MKPYLALLQRILDKDRKSNDRTGTGTIKVAGEMMKFDLMRDGVKILPAVTTKKLYFNSVVSELLWFRDGETNAMSLIAQNNKIWNDWMMPEDVLKNTPLEQTLRVNAYGMQLEPALSNQDAAKAISAKAIQRLFERHGNPEYAPGQIVEGRIYQRLEISHEIDAILDEAHIPADTTKNLHLKGDLGPIYGHTWRHAPAGDYFKNMSDNEVREYLAMMAPDQRKQIDDVTYDRTFNVQHLGAVREYLTLIGIDQLSQALHKLKTNPNDRRIIVDAWTPQFIPIDKGKDMEGLTQAEISQLNVRRGRAALAYCHVLYQFLTEELTTDERLELLPKREWGGNNAIGGTGLFMPSILALSHIYVKELSSGKIADADIPKDADGNVHNAVGTEEMLNALKVPKFKLNCVVYQRSADSFLGVAFNVASYGLLTHMVAQVSDMLPGELTWMGGDVHLYRNHLDGVREQLSREPYPPPKLHLNPEITNLFAFTTDDIKLVNYQHHPAIKGDISV
jgi:thymidylate synthase